MTINNPLGNEPAPTATQSSAKMVNWKQVGAFIGLTFGLTWLLDLILFLNGGLTNPAAITALQLQMLLPAFSAMLLGMFFFKDSPIYKDNNHTKSRWFIWYFLIFTLLYIAAVTVAFIRPDLVQLLNSVMLVPGLLGLVLVIALRVAGGKGTFTSVGMGGGRPLLWLLYGLAILLFIGLQTVLNWLFKMGQAPDLSLLFAQASAAGMTPTIMMIVITAQTIILGPFLGLLVTFGEEYGWRGYLQTSLYGLGRARGVALVGVIWGIWHWPVIWMGHNYPGHPYLGSLLMVLFCIGLAYILGYAVLKARGVWIAAFLHALVNQSFAYSMGMIYTPRDTALSFGIGVYGLIVFALVVALILRDPVWKQSE